MNQVTLQRQAVPAYFHPEFDAEEWSRLANADVALVVANVADGPGLVREKTWALALDLVRASGAHVVGYVDVGYLGLTGLRTWLGATYIDDWLEQILHDINTWYRLYGDVLTGIFFDQVAESEDGASVAPVFRRLRDHVRMLDPKAVTVLNPGVAIPVSFAGIADVLVTFEGSSDTYLAEQGDLCFEPLSWRPGPDQLIWHIVHHTAGAARATEVVALSRIRGAGLLYVTDGDGDNPYSSLPSTEITVATNSTAGVLPSGPARMRRRRNKKVDPTLEADTQTPEPASNSALISNPTLVRDHSTIEASADFVLPSSCRRVFLASRRRNVPRWWTGSSPQIAADWLVENNRLYAYSGTGTDWTWTPTAQVIFEALGSNARWCLEVDVIGLGQDADVAAVFHVSALGRSEYSEVAVGYRATDEPDHTDPPTEQTSR
jgi:hypothetical protein